MEARSKPAIPARAAVNEIAPFVHVGDVERSLRFYEQFGLARGDTLTHEGRTFWGALRNGAAHVMFAQANPPIDHEAQGVLFYLYTKDVKALRLHLLACGLRDAGNQAGPMKPEPNGVLFGITHPVYMPAGELRVHDPDGYVLLIGQRQ